MIFILLDYLDRISFCKSVIYHVNIWFHHTHTIDLNLVKSTFKSLIFVFKQDSWLIGGDFQAI